MYVTTALPLDCPLSLFCYLSDAPFTCSAPDMPKMLGKLTNRELCLHCLVKTSTREKLGFCDFLRVI